MPATLPSTISLKTAYEFAFSPSGRQVAFIGGRDVTVLDVGSRKPLFAVHPIANPSHIDFSPDGQRLVVKGTSGRTIILNAKTGQLLTDFRNQKEGEGDSALFSPCGRFVLSVSRDGLFSIRSVETAEPAFTRAYSDCQLTKPSTTADRSLFVYSVGGRPRTPTGLTPCKVRCCRWASPEEEHLELAQEWAAIWGLQISPSGRFLAIVHGTPPETLEIFDIKRSRKVAECNWSGSPGCSIAWTKDEMTLVTNGDDCFRVYSLPNLKVTRELPVKYPCFAQFSPDEDLVALGSWQKSFVVPTGCLDEFEMNKRKST